MNPVKFRCKRSGNIVSFTLPGDIEGLRKHEGYVEIKDEEVKIEAPTEKVLAQRGRPRKEHLPTFMEV